MRTIVNDCVSCESCGNCGNREVEHIVCDECESEGAIYELEGEELCLDCIKGKLLLVEG